MSLLLPMMSKNELSLLEKYISEKDNVCEYGSGGSTSWLASRVKSISSIEHNLVWYEKTSTSLANLKNARLYHVPSLPNWNYLTEGSYEEFKDYIHFPENLDTVFSFFLVDGRARVDCCRLISEKFPNSTIAFHDYVNRANDGEHNYSRVLNYFRLIETSETLAIFRKK